MPTAKNMNIDAIIEMLMAQRVSVPNERAMLVAISGIDGSGKGYITQQIATRFQQQPLAIATVNIDGWLNLPDQRFGTVNPAEHFYHHAIRFDALFTQLVFPLRDQRSISLDMDYTEETAIEYRQHRYQFTDIDIILLEGIYLLKRQFQSYYDLSIWVDCSFETALERAIARSQEGLSPEATVTAYQTFYFPAQEYHFVFDHPKSSATVIINNDPKLA